MFGKSRYRPVSDLTGLVIDIPAIHSDPGNGFDSVHFEGYSTILETRRPQESGHRGSLDPKSENSLADSLVKSGKDCRRMKTTLRPVGVTLAAVIGLAAVPPWGHGPGAGGGTPEALLQQTLRDCNGAHCQGRRRQAVRLGHLTMPATSCGATSARKTPPGSTPPRTLRVLHQEDAHRPRRVQGMGRRRPVRPQYLGGQSRRRRDQLAPMLAFAELVLKDPELKKSKALPPRSTCPGQARPFREVGQARHLEGRRRLGLLRRLGHGLLEGRPENLEEGPPPCHRRALQQEQPHGHLRPAALPHHRRGEVARPRLQDLRLHQEPLPARGR